MLPKIDRGILSSILVEIDGPQRDPNWAENMFNRLKIENPIMADYLFSARKQYGEVTALVGLIVCRLIESQMEADDLDELFGT